MLNKFRTYQLSLELYRHCKGIKLPGYLKNQLMRAASSVSLNLAEGSAKFSRKDKLRFYTIAFASLREVQGLIGLEPEKMESVVELSDHLGACLYKLTTQ